MSEGNSEYVPKKPRPGITIYREALTMLLMTDDTTAGTIVKAAASRFLLQMEPPAFDGMAALIWDKVNYDIERGGKKYRAACERNWRNANKGHENIIDNVPLANQSQPTRVPVGNQWVANPEPLTPNIEPRALNSEPRTTTTTTKILSQEEGAVGKGAGETHAIEPYKNDGLASSASNRPIDDMERLKRDFKTKNGLL